MSTGCQIVKHRKVFHLLNLLIALRWVSCVERWRELFDLPSAVNRRRHYENALRVAVTSRHCVLPPIVYVNDGTVLQQADPGTRLLKRLSCDPQVGPVT